MGRKRNEITLKEPVRIREKVLKDGNRSLYLDIYMNGNRKKEGLKLYLVPEVSAAARQQNSNTWKLAEQVKAQRILDIQKVGMVDWDKVRKVNTTLTGWVDRFIRDKEGMSEASIQGYRSMKKRIAEYLAYINKEDIPLSKVDREFARGFIAFLRTCTYNNGSKMLSTTTQRSFVDALATVIDSAIREGIVSVNPFRLLDRKEKPRKQSREKEFLTLDELRKAIGTPCRCPMLKQAFLFSCFTGLRWSDVTTLEWKHVHVSADGRSQYIEKQQVKTRHDVVVPLCRDALKWMPERRDGGKTVFHELHISLTTAEVILREWMEAAGIRKHITYHCSRHTAATMWLTLGANLYVVSKLLGHRSIKVTEVYARIVDQTKIDTMNLVNNMFSAGTAEVGTADAR